MNQTCTNCEVVEQLYTCFVAIGDILFLVTVGNPATKLCWQICKV